MVKLSIKQKDSHHKFHCRFSKLKFSSTLSAEVLMFIVWLAASAIALMRSGIFQWNENCKNNSAFPLRISQLMRCAKIVFLMDKGGLLRMGTHPTYSRLFEKLKEKATTSVCFLSTHLERIFMGILDSPAIIISGFQQLND
ncbi:hypothetical protein CDAR_482991 [Caerostris darwini]|uniref:Uncharacterized protein n=1 Tax=Caerostris darwini TaxID=1538125 RepID=A0AAV4MPQ7_9ARAC|nr:hypothetical protein CDAR_482991 [Caerostris darwini]